MELETSELYTDCRKRKTCPSVFSATTVDGSNPLVIESEISLLNNITVYPHSWEKHYWVKRAELVLKSVVERKAGPLSLVRVVPSMTDTIDSVNEAY